MSKKFIGFTGSELGQHSIDGKRNWPLHKMRCIGSWTTLPSGKSNGLGGHQLPMEVIWHMPKGKVPCGLSWPNGPAGFSLRLGLTLQRTVQCLLKYIYHTILMIKCKQCTHPVSSWPHFHKTISHLPDEKAASLHSLQAGFHGWAQ